MEVLEAPDAVRDRVRAWRCEGLTVGLVPTMGALHVGHESLMNASVAECDRTVISIYVNPTQFGPDEDLDDYPRRLERDCEIAQRVGVDLVFTPSNDVMYPAGYATYITQQRLTEGLCGAFRPVHFRGVLTVVAKLLNIVPARRVYFGQKDFQQSVVIRRMVEDLNFPVEVRVMPTVREEDGLAVSSRNQYLTPDQRRQAVCLYGALTEAAELYRNGETSPARIVERMRRVIAQAPEARPQYIEIVDRETLERVEEVSDRAVAALAVHLGDTRLIDNMSFAD